MDRLGKIELLVQVAVLVNVHGNLLLHVHLTAIYLVGDSCAQMLQTCHPRKRITTQNHLRKFSWLFQECHALGLALSWIRICGEPQVVGISILSQIFDCCGCKYCFTLLWVNRERNQMK